MPATTPRGSKQEHFEPAKFLSSKLSAEQKDGMLEWASTYSFEQMIGAAEKIVLASYILSLRMRDGVAQASMTPQSNGSKHRNAGLVLVSRASTPAKALLGLFFRHFEVYAEDWTGVPVSEETEW